MQNTLCFSQEAVVFMAQVNVGCHAIMLHQSDGHGNVAHGVEKVMAMFRQLSGERVEEVDMCRVTDVDEDIHMVLKRIP